MNSKRSTEDPEDPENGSVKRFKPSGNPKHPLQRDLSKGMNPVTLLTGYYGARGERIRHVVHEGALRLPKDALDLCAKSSSSSKDFALPELDSVSRPTVDTQRRSVLVTDLSKEMAGGEQDVKRVPKTVAKNRVILHDDDPVRIRGGGEDSESVPKEPTGAEDASGSIQGVVPTAADAQTTVTATDNAGGTPVSIPPISNTVNPFASQGAVASNSSGDLSKIPSQATPNATVNSGATTPQAVSSGAPTVPSSASKPAPTAAVPSSASKPAPTAEVLGLSKQPASVWEQHNPGPNDEMTIDPNTTSPKPEWFKQNEASAFERSLLPEWFDGSSSHRTEKSYLQTRAKLMEMSDKLGTRYLTATMARRSVPGDAGSLMRLHSFLCSYNLINEHSINDSAPLPVSMQEPTGTKKGWDESLQESLLEAVVKESKQSNPINWENVSKLVGHGKKPAECEQQFLSMQIPEEAASGSVERSITPDMEEPSLDKKLDAASLSQMLQHLVANSDPHVIHSVTSAALESTRNNLTETQQSVAVGLAVSQAEKVAQAQEARVGQILSEIVELRMQKLENRLALLDDVEGMLEAERAALELERRDLYTARCRYWFQGP